MKPGWPHLYIIYHKINVTSVAGGKVIRLTSLHLEEQLIPFTYRREGASQSLHTDISTALLCGRHATTLLLRVSPQRARSAFLLTVTCLLFSQGYLMSKQGGGGGGTLGDDGSEHDNSRPCLARLPRSLSSAVKQGRNPIKESARCRCRLFFNLHPTFCGSPSVLCEPQVTLIWSCQSTCVCLDLCVARLFNSRDVAGLKKKKEPGYWLNTIQMIINQFHTTS